jgi:hypothetical protein
MHCLWHRKAVSFDPFIRVFAAEIIPYSRENEKSWINSILLAFRQCAVILSANRKFTTMISCFEQECENVELLDDVYVQIGILLDIIEQEAHDRVFKFIPALEHLFKKMAHSSHYVQEPILAIIAHVFEWMDRAIYALEKSNGLDNVLMCAMEILVRGMDEQSVTVFQTSTESIVTFVFGKIVRFSQWEHTRFGSISSVLLEIFKSSKKTKSTQRVQKSMWKLVCYLSGISESRNNISTSSECIWNLVQALIEQYDPSSLSEQ